MKIDMTGIVGDGGFVALSPGRYNVVTKDEWSVKRSDAGNMVLRIPFVVQDEGEFEGVVNSLFHTIMLEGKPDKIRTNRGFTMSLLAGLGLLSVDDRMADGTGPLFEFEIGDPDENGRAPVYAIVVNETERRALGDIPAKAVVVVDSGTQSGTSVKTLEPNGKPAAPKAAPQTQAAAPAAAKPKAAGGGLF